jgi:hypothetical protein
MPAPTRTPEQIRDSIEQNRQQLAVSLDHLRGEVVALTDWRRQLTIHRREALIGAAVVGFVIGGGIAGLGGLVFGRRKRKRR